MPEFYYEARNTNGKRIHGYLTAENVDELAQALALNEQVLLQTRRVGFKDFCWRRWFMTIGIFFAVGALFPLTNARVRASFLDMGANWAVISLVSGLSFSFIAGLLMPTNRIRNEGFRKLMIYLLVPLFFVLSFIFIANIFIYGTLLPPDR